MTKTTNIHRLEHICNEVRKRICVGEYADGQALYEEKLAKEFEVSRTPIRQVLHRLALERFVETKSGIGTLIIPTDRVSFKDDQNILVKTLTMMANLSPTSINADDRIELAALLHMSKILVEDFSVNTYWNVCYRYNYLIREKIRHDLMRDTTHILFCRLYRWLLVSFTPEKVEFLTQTLLNELQQANELVETEDNASSLLLLRANAILALSN
ncbi:GntR family transcriptional regulator [Marinomonas ushuaiensis DSM 15871]|uniref:GntR family transcriptional regulator n=1 Tax=Marinomonas ushuaiensis DSM 15871 TaxID=1122207 RepID=X7E8T6_9GAMM|nr:winged helix-turn-helix domain-containing protein [Marinomonas ushuaiensis]ETX12265.1 GntR family transcriptional regulator [Marinomonas ushuaiensis DSM 15871]